MRPQHRPATASRNVADVTEMVHAMPLIRTTVLLCDWLRIERDKRLMMKSRSG
jgi:hypothetical protein